MNRREIILAAAAAACAPAASQPARAFPIRRGVNLGNALEAPNEGEWGYRIEQSHLTAIAGAGFDGVRLPVRWDAHADSAGNIDARFLARVAEVVGWTLDAGLKAQLDLHHYDGLIEARPGERERFIAMWRIIAERFSEAPAALIFEPLNEPFGDHWRGEALTHLQRDALVAIRETNPTRLVVLGPGNWQNINALDDWRPPAEDNIAASVHYYEPYAFTHQNAEWLGPNAPRYPRAWGNGGDVAEVATHIGRAADWAAAHGVAMQLGEFGVNARVPLAQRVAWTRAVRRACEARGLGWCVWDFAGAFPVWDRDRRAFIPNLLDALIG